MASKRFGIGILCCISWLALGARAAVPAHDTGVACNNRGVCKIEVTVNDSQTPCTVAVDKPDVSIGSAVNVRWEIVDSTRVFAADGIVFDADPPSPFNAVTAPKPNEFRVHDAKTHKGVFHYVVNVEGCAPLDPYVRNN